MRTFVFSALLACVAFTTVNTGATPTGYPRGPTADNEDPWHLKDHTLAPQPSPPPERFRYVGMNFDLGVPDGAALGVVVRPDLNWLRLNVAVAYNGLAPGLRGGLTLDPINFPVVPTATFEAGHFWDGTIPGVSDSPQVGYDYVNLHLGLEFGKRDTWRFYLRGGASWIDAHVGGFQHTINLPSGVSVGDPQLEGWFPSAKLGFAIYF